MMNKLSYLDWIMHLIIHNWKVIVHLLSRQEDQMSQRGRAMFRVVDYFAKSPKVSQGHSEWQPWIVRVYVHIRIPL